MQTPPVQKNQLVELEIESLAFGGMGLAKIDGFVVFVKDTAPGDRVRARIRKRQSNHAQADVETMLRPAASRIEPDCPLHNRCGGCDWQFLPYEQQLRTKEMQVAESLQHIARARELPLEPIEPSPREWRFRNKMEFTFGRNIAGETILGFHTPGRFDQIFETPACLIHPTEFDAALTAAQDWARRSGLAPHDPRTHGGVLRTLTLRKSEGDGRWLAMLCTKTTAVGKRLNTLADALSAASPNFAGLVWAYNDGIADVVRVDSVAGVWGQPELTERLDEFEFKVSPTSFFQTNTRGAELLYRITREFLMLTGRETLFDAYCGTGSIGIFCSRQAKRVIGVENVREAVWNARENAARNKCGDCVFIAAPMEDGVALARTAAAPGSIDRIVIDPPRGGMDKRSLRDLLAIRAPVFVYVSCNPATMSRDVERILESGYDIKRIKPVDMFPHSHHIETVMQFVLGK